MTRIGSARVAGFTCLLYVAAGASHEFLIGRATAGEGTGETLARVAGHAMDVRLSILLTLLESFSALVLAVTLYSLTRDEDQELALLALVCRAVEGVIGAIAIPKDLGLLWLANARAGAAAPDDATAHALGAFFLMPGGPVGAVFFAVGSTLFSYLLLRGRLVPAPLAGFGVFASVLLAVGLPLQLAGFLTGPLAGLLWLPAFVYAPALGLWLLIRGVATPATR
jgi:hypothetical protein